MKRRNIIKKILLFVIFLNLYIPINAYATSDTTGPELTLSSVQFTKGEIGINEYNTLKAYLTDPSGVTSVSYYTNKGASSFLSEDNEHFTGYFKGERFGRVQLEAIIATDGSGNSSCYVNEQNREKYADRERTCDFYTVDFSNLYFDVVGNYEDDTTGPELTLSSVQFTKGEIGINEYNTLKAYLTDPSGVTSVSYYTNKGASSFLSEDNEHFTGYFKGERFGRVQLEAIIATDGSGNSSCYVNEQNREKYADRERTCDFYTVDFSNLYFDVVKEGLENILVLPTGLNAIGSEAFHNLPNVNAVQISASVSTIAEDAFDSNIVIIAPQNSYAINWAQNHGFEYIIIN